MPAPGSTPKYFCTSARNRARLVWLTIRSSPTGRESRHSQTLFHFYRRLYRNPSTKTHAPMNALRSIHARRFLRDTRGSILPVFVVMMFVVIAMIGMGVDYTRASLANAKMQAAAGCFWTVPTPARDGGAAWRTAATEIRPGNSTGARPVNTERVRQTQRTQSRVTFVGKAHPFQSSRNL